jgi:excisionase family DNA binding protein
VSEANIEGGKAAYTINEFCQLFSVSRSKVYELIDEGSLATRKMGRKTLIRAEDARAWLNALPKGKAAA